MLCPQAPECFRQFAVGTPINHTPQSQQFFLHVDRLLFFLPPPAVLIHNTNPLFPPLPIRCPKICAVRAILGPFDGIMTAPVLLASPAVKAPLPTRPSFTHTLVITAPTEACRYRLTSLYIRNHPLPPCEPNLGGFLFGSLIKNPVSLKQGPCLAFALPSSRVTCSYHRSRRLLWIPPQITSQVTNATTTFGTEPQLGPLCRG